ncbi:hypothetical protein BEQ56_06875 [Anaerolineaceae bacterium oral taxon 439]|nr:hypothetical protein BEQ56_06875 [Anaerolineaceae bacterium oral taxon 439]
MQEIENILAAQSNFRNAAMICTQITGAKVSPATLGRDVHRVSGRIAESDRLSFPEEKGKIEIEILYGESDGIHVRLQRDPRGKKSVEIRAAIACPGRNGCPETEN